MIQQKRHYKCQSLWPWSTQDTIPWTEVMSLVVSDWQMYKQPYLWYCCSWTWGTCHLCHFTTIAISPNVLITLSPPSGSQFASLAICPPLSIHRFTAALNAHTVVIHIFKLIIISLGFCWVIYFLIPTSFFSPFVWCMRSTQIKGENGNGNTNGKECGTRVIRQLGKRLGEYFFYLMCKI